MLWISTLRTGSFTIVLMRNPSHKSPTILITGAGGVVGSYAPSVFSANDLLLTDLVESRGISQLDVTDTDAVHAAIRTTRPDVVLHLAAATDVDRCEQDPDVAFRVNAIGTENVAHACRESGALLVYISTAGVFGGGKPDPYTEFDAPDPANIYGHSKLAGERTVSSMLDRYFIVRAGWMVGGASLEKKFVGMMIRQLEAGATHLRAVHDKFGSPTYAPDLLRGIRTLLDTNRFGLFHMVNDGSCSRYDVAVALCELLGRDDVDVEPVSSAAFPLPAPRARSEAMRNYKLELHGLPRQRPWKDALETYVLTELQPARHTATRVAAS